MLQRIAVICLVLFVIWRLLAALGRRGQGAGADSYSRFSPEARRRRRAGAAGSNRLVACAGCEAMIPEDRALSVSGGRFACGSECLDRLERGV